MICNFYEIDDIQGSRLDFTCFIAGTQVGVCFFFSLWRIAFTYREARRRLPKLSPLEACGRDAEDLNEVEIGRGVLSSDA